MGWRERRGVASWKGIVFEPVSIQFQIGQRTVLHQFPLRDTPFIEELGRMARAFQVSGYVIGENYDLARNRLANAIEQGGAGALVLPTLGRRTVKVDGGVTFTEPQTEQGRASFDLRFVETGARSFPEVLPQLGTGVSVSRDNLVDVAKSTFVNRFRAVGEGLAGWVQERARSYATQIVETTLTSGFTRTWNTEGIELIEELTEAAVDLLTNINALTADPPALAEAWANYLEPLRELWLPSILSVEGLTPTPTDAKVGSVSWDQDVENTLATSRLVRRILLGNAVEASTTSLDLQSLEEASDVEALLLDVFALELAESDVDEDGALFDGLYLTKLAWLDWLEGEVTGLATQATFTPPQTIPAFVLANRFYGSPDRWEELVDRNAVEHPLFVLGGRPIRYLTQ